MGWIIGFEPTTSRATTWRSNQLSYIHHLLARLKGLEPLTYCLEGSCSIQLSYKRIYLIVERVMGIEPTRPAWKAGILPLNYTRTCCATLIIIHNRSPIVKPFLKNIRIFLSQNYRSARFEQTHIIICVKEQFYRQ